MKPPSEKPGPAFVGDKMQHPTRKTPARVEDGASVWQFLNSRIAEGNSE